jgi:hypothetical protein
VPAIIAARGHQAGRRFVEFSPPTCAIATRAKPKPHHRRVLRLVRTNCTLCKRRTGSLRNHGDLDGGAFSGCTWKVRINLLDIEWAMWPPGREPRTGFFDTERQQALAAIRMLFDWLMGGQVLAVNSSRWQWAGQSIRGLWANALANAGRKSGICSTR